MEKILWVALVLAGGCSSGNYECGTALDDSTEIHVCGRTDEVCICATHSCAFRLADNTFCESGYRYSDTPFVSDEKLAKKCVPMELVEKRIEANAEIKSCSPAADAGVDAPADDAAVDAMVIGGAP